MRVLVTGFAPWAEHVENPSTTLALAMDGLQIGKTHFIARAPLPVEFARAEAVAHQHALDVHANTHVALGLAANTPHVRIERIGRNRATTSVADNAGVIAKDIALVDDGVDHIETDIDTGALARFLLSRGVETQVSEDAGGYVCNDLYYRALLRAKDNGRRVIFIHVPTDVMKIEGIAHTLAEALAHVL